MDKKQLFETELGETLDEGLNAIDGRIMNDDLVRELTDNLNKRAAEVYARHNVSGRKDFTVEFVSFLITMAAISGSLRLRPAPYQHYNDITPTDPEAHDPRLLQDAEETFEEGPQPSVGVSSYENPEASQFFIGTYNPATDTIDWKEFDMDGTTSAEEPVGVPDFNMGEGFADDLQGNFSGYEWAVKFQQLMNIHPRGANDLDLLTGWFANAIMTGYDKAKQEDHPVQELSDSDLVFVEFYNHSGPGHPRNVVATLKFPNLESAKTFVKFNGFGSNFDAQYVEFYELATKTTYTRRKIE